MTNDKPIFIVGSDRALADRLASALAPEPVRVVEQVTFMDAQEARAHTLVCVEAASTGRAAPADLRALIKAAEAPSVSRVIVATFRPDADDDLRRLRRSGARYVIVRPPDLVDAAELRGKRVLVPRDVAAAPFTTLEDLIAALVGAIRDSSLMGVTIDVPPSGLGALEAAGVMPRVVAPWRAKVGRWFGQPVFAPRAAQSAVAAAP
jgi:hypothetical protein